MLNLLIASDSDNGYIVTGKTMRKILIAVTTVTLASAAYSAQIDIRPGLWEMNASSNLLSLAEQIPPEQMQGLNNLAKQYGFEMPKIQNGAAKSEICITPEMAAQKIPPSFYNRQSGCEARNATRIDNRFSADLVCNSGNVQGEGKTDATLLSAESFSGTTSFRGTVQGVPVDDRANTSGRWIAANCSAAKPITR
jgi:hypothetical protein